METAVESNQELIKKSVQETMFFNFLDPKYSRMLTASNVMDSTLLITGQTGTGKSHLAYSVHCASKRGHLGRWFKINLATLSDNLMESELFGHERGSFTGADCKRLGKLEIANGGTVFLDEIGELPLRLQSKILDFIQYKKITPVGSNREIELDVRVIVATNKDLEAEVKAGRFREDLFHRLNVFHIKLEEICFTQKKVKLLAKFILNKKSEKAKKRILGFSMDVFNLFEEYHWPGNIRELENVIEYAVALEKTHLISVTSLPAQFVALQKEISDSDSSEEVGSEKEKISKNCLEIPFTMDYHESKSNFERLYLESVLKMFSGQINLTSRMTKLNKVSLCRKMKKHQIDGKKLRGEPFLNYRDGQASKVYTQ